VYHLIFTTNQQQHSADLKYKFPWLFTLKIIPLPITTWNEGKIKKNASKGNELSSRK